MATLTLELQKNTKRKNLEDHFQDVIEVNPELERRLVSFQANKKEPFYRWFKYKEGFSSALIKYVVESLGKSPGLLLDPFAGAGSALFAVQELGWQSHGIELLPVGTFSMKVREASRRVDVKKFKVQRDHLLAHSLYRLKVIETYFDQVPITQQAFSKETERLLGRYLTYCETIEDKNVKLLFLFAAFCVLEEVSFTRKDGQYLRWDHRSGKNGYGKKKFFKGDIPTFEAAIKAKLNQILFDLEAPQNEILFNPNGNGHKNSRKIQPIKTFEGSCLNLLPKIENSLYDLIITSPPYCNRYDYTRTYALELVFLGADEGKIKDLRQTMLSCTVENKEKLEEIRKIYEGLSRLTGYEHVREIYFKCPAMQEVNAVLDDLNKQGVLNNSNIPRMVKNYFFEMCFVIFEMERILKPGGYAVMVNDNVRYGGEEVPVDLILSYFAEQFGLTVEKIWVLPRGKGNSSQQMGNFGRTELRKCVYLWRKD